MRAPPPLFASALGRYRLSCRLAFLLGSPDAGLGGGVENGARAMTYDAIRWYRYGTVLSLVYLSDACVASTLVSVSLFHCRCRQRLCLRSIGQGPTY